MSARTGQSGDKAPAEKPSTAQKPHADPEWADGLRQLYNSVVDEELPDSFKDLLSKLDESD